MQSSHIKSTTISSCQLKDSVNSVLHVQLASNLPHEGFIFSQLQFQDANFTIAYLHRSVGMGPVYSAYSYIEKTLKLA